MVLASKRPYCAVLSGEAVYAVVDGAASEVILVAVLLPNLIPPFLLFLFLHSREADVEMTE